MRPRWTAAERHRPSRRVTTPERLRRCGKSVSGRASPPSIAQQVDLARLCFSVLLNRSHEGEPPAIRCPTRRGVADARGQPPRRFRRLAGGHGEERRLVPVLLLVHGHPHERHGGSVRRNLRIRDPCELEKIGFGDESFARGTGRGHREQYGAPERHDRDSALHEELLSAIRDQWQPPAISYRLTAISNLQ